MTVFDLFSGIGGLALGLHRAGFEIIGLCEIEPWARKVLRRHWPHLEVEEDARDIISVESDWITGGPPCHRTSVAAAIHGYRTGETLWPEMFRIVRNSKPKGVIVEQPPTPGISWEAKVKGDLEKIGYSVAKHEIPAEFVGAPHLRRRMFFVAHRHRTRLAQPEATRRSQIAAKPWYPALRGHWVPPVPELLRVDDGVPARLDRRKRVSWLGRTTVPQVAEALGRIILERS